MNAFQTRTVGGYRKPWVRWVFKLIAISLPIISALLVAYVKEASKELKELGPLTYEYVKGNVWWLSVLLPNISLCMVWFAGLAKTWAAGVDAGSLKRSLLSSLVADFLPAIFTQEELRASADADHRITVFRLEGQSLRVFSRSSEMTENSEVSWRVSSRSANECEGVAGRGFSSKAPFTVPENRQSQHLPDVSHSGGVQPSIEKIKEYAKMTNTTIDKVRSGKWRARSYAVAPILIGRRRRVWGVTVLDSVTPKPLTVAKLRILEQVGVAAASCIEIVEPTNGDDE